MEGWTIWPFVEGEPGVFNIQREYYDNRWTEDNRNGSIQLLMKMLTRITNVVLLSG